MQTLREPESPIHSVGNGIDELMRVAHAKPRKYELFGIVLQVPVVILQVDNLIYKLYLLILV